MALSMYEAMLREAGLKITVPRVKILTLFHNMPKRHWSAEALWQELQNQGEEVALATVYRVLTQFEMCALVERHCFENDTSVFELNKNEHHDHLVCLECGSIAEFFDNVIEQHQKNIAARFHFNMSDHRLIIYGFCANCC